MDSFPNDPQFPWRTQRAGDDCWVYIMAHLEDGEAVAPVKVGISVRPRIRLKEVQRQAGAPLVIVAKFALWRRQLAYDVEQAFHKACAEFCCGGEWFDFDPQDAVGLMSENLKALVDYRLGPMKGSWVSAYLWVNLPGYGQFVDSEAWATAHGGNA